jgi:hypothetical protein
MAYDDVELPIPRRIFADGRQLDTHDSENIDEAVDATEKVVCRLEHAFHFVTRDSVCHAWDPVQGCCDILCERLVAAGAEYAGACLRERMNGLLADTLASSQHHEATTVEPRQVAWNVVALDADHCVPLPQADTA